MQDINNDKLVKLLRLGILAAIDAGKAIMDIFNQNSLEVHAKSDNSPVTIADIRANNIIGSIIGKSGLPSLSEEGINVPYEERRLWKYFWLIDPLDGTKEFIEGSSDFAVNIAFIVEKQPRAGVIYVPAKDILYAGIEEIGSWRFNDPWELKLAISDSFTQTPEKDREKMMKKSVDQDIENVLINNSWLNNGIPLPCINKKEYGILTSHSFRDDRTDRFIARFSKRYKGTRIISRGSSLKMCMLAEGEADIYPRFSNISEWDTAAGHAIILGSGGSVVQASNTDQQLVYNKKESLNPWFIGYRNKELLDNIKDLIPYTGAKD